MEPISFSSEQAAVRFAIEGDWSAAIYHRVNSVFIVRQAIDGEERFNAAAREKQNYDQQVFSWHSEFFGTSLHHPMGNIGTPAPPYEKILELTRVVSQPLGVDAISYGVTGLDTTRRGLESFEGHVRIHHKVEGREHQARSEQNEVRE